MDNYNNFTHHLFSTYLTEISDRESLDNILNLLYDSLYEHKIEKDFDSIVFSGMSGALVAPLLGYKLHKNICGVRKRGEKTHSDYKIEGVLTKNYVILDDISSTGGTIERIQKIIKKELTLESEAFNIKPPWQANLVGIVLYGIGNDAKKLQELADQHCCWILWQDRLFQPTEPIND